MRKDNFLPARFRSTIQRDRYLYLILVLGFLLRLGAFICFTPWEETIEDKFVLKADAEMYHDHALIVLKGDYPFSDRVSPGFPILVATIYYTFGVKPWAVLLFNILLNVLCVYFVYRLALSLFDEKIATLASLFLAVDVHQIVFTQTLLTDTAFSLLITLSIYLILKNFNKKRLIFLVFAGVSLALAVLIRPIGVYFYLFIIAFIVLFQAGLVKNRLLKSSVFFFAYVLVLSPVIGLNYSNFQHFGVSRLGGLNFLYVNAMSVFEIQGGKSHEESIKIVEQLVQKSGGDSLQSPEAKEDLYYKVGLRIIEQNLTSYLVNHITGSLNIYTSLSTYNIARVLRLETHLMGEKFFGYPVHLQIDSFIEKKSTEMLLIGIFVVIMMLFSYTGSVFGIFYLLKQKKYFELTLLLLPIVYLTIVTGVVGNARFKLPISPFLLILCAYGINSFLNNRLYQKQNISQT